MSLHSLMFGWEYPPATLGGLGVACQGLVNGLLRRGVKVTLVLPHAEGKQDGAEIVFPTNEHYEEMRETIRVQSLLNPYDSEEEFLNRVSHMLQSSPRLQGDIYGKNLGEAIACFTEMSVTMTRHTEPDVVHCHDWMTYDAGIRAAVHHDAPLVTHIHATELDRTHFSPNQWIYDVERRGFEAADRIVAVSGYTKNIITEHYGIPSDKISVVHNGTSDMHDPEIVRLHSESRKKQKPMILFLGRLALQKGAWQFLDMAAMVHRLNPDVQFVMAGDGHMLPELVNRACQLGLQDCILFAGKVSNSEARKLYAKASCFVMPSLSEPFGLVALEAVAHGTPVILSKQSGVAEVVNHCFTVNFWDTERMADCALTILREESLARQLSTEAPRMLRDLTWENQADKVSSIYRDVLNI